MGNLFTPVDGNKQMPNAIARPDGTHVSFNAGKFFKNISRQIRKPSPQSVNKAPGNFSNTSSNKKFYNYNDVINAVAMQESNNNYKAKGKMLIRGDHAGTRALGKYQFMPKTLAGLGINVSNENFINSPKLQERAMKLLTLQNAKTLGIKDINHLNQRQFKAITSAHYIGASKAKKWYNSGDFPGFTNPQYNTGEKMPSASDYANSTLGYANTNTTKTSELNKAQYVFDKLINGE